MFADAAGVKHHRPTVGRDDQRAIALVHVNEVNAHAVVSVEHETDRDGDERRDQKIFYERRATNDQSDDRIVGDGGDRLQRREVDARARELGEQRRQFISGAECQAQQDADEFGKRRHDECDQSRRQSRDDDHLEDRSDDQVGEQ